MTIHLRRRGWGMVFVNVSHKRLPPNAVLSGCFPQTTFFRHRFFCCSFAVIIAPEDGICQYGNWICEVPDMPRRLLLCPSDEKQILLHHTDNAFRYLPPHGQKGVVNIHHPVAPLPVRVVISAGTVRPLNEKKPHILPI